MNQPKIALIIPAAGLGRRLGSKTPKAFVKICGTPLLIHTLKNLTKKMRFDEVIVAVATKEITKAAQLFKKYHLKNIQVVVGGATRAESVKNAVLKTRSDCQFVFIHDAARPLVSTQTLKQLLETAQATGACFTALAVNATVKEVDPKNYLVEKTLDRNKIFLAQTPQVFKRELLLKRYQDLGPKAMRATDEAALFDETNISVKIVSGDASNIKITTPQDLLLAKFYLGKK